VGWGAVVWAYASCVSSFLHGEVIFICSRADGVPYSSPLDWRCRCLTSVAFVVTIAATREGVREDGRLSYR